MISYDFDITNDSSTPAWESQKFWFAPKTTLEKDEWLWSTAQFRALLEEFNPDTNLFTLLKTSQESGRSSSYSTLLELEKRFFSKLAGFHQSSTISSADQARHIVVSSFAAEPLVDKIYEGYEADGTEFWIFTTNQKYDSELMDRLLQREQEILQQVRHGNLPPIWVNYVPLLLCDSPDDVISINAHLIFTRE